MLKAAIARKVFGILGNVISLGFFFSPAPTFYKIIKKEDVEEFKHDPYLATLPNCAFWVFYGITFWHPHNIFSILNVTINIIGLLLQPVYLTIFYKYSTNKRRNKLLRSLFWWATLIYFLGIYLATIHERAHRMLYAVVRISCHIFNIMMYASPLTIVANVMRTKSVKYMPLWLSIATFLNGVCWIIYALIHPIDIYVLISNDIGAISGIVQLILYAREKMLKIVMMSLS